MRKSGEDESVGVSADTYYVATLVEIILVLTRTRSLTHACDANALTMTKAIHVDSKHNDCVCHNSIQTLTSNSMESLFARVRPDC